MTKRTKTVGKEGLTKPNGAHQRKLEQIYIKEQREFKDNYLAQPPSPHG